MPRYKEVSIYRWFRETEGPEPREHPNQGGESTARLQREPMGPVNITMIVRPYPGRDLQGIKEAMAMYCEQFGDIGKVTITAAEIKAPEQMSL